jgi:hypothetical protein
MTTKLVKETAKELAGAFFDNVDVFHDGRVERTMRFRAECPDAETFVRRYWKDFVVVARKVLAHMLTEPGRSQAEKDEIYDALLKERGAKTDLDLAAPSIMRLH